MAGCRSKQLWDWEARGTYDKAHLRQACVCSQCLAPPPGGHHPCTPVSFPSPLLTGIVLWVTTATLTPFACQLGCSVGQHFACCSMLPSGPQAMGTESRPCPFHATCSRGFANEGTNGHRTSHAAKAVQSRGNLRYYSCFSQIPKSSRKTQYSQKAKRGLADAALLQPAAPATCLCQPGD